MSENLRYDVPGVYGASDTINTNNPSVKYGRLYDWATVMNGSGSSSTSPSGVQGICPSGWHVPSDEEWKTLEKSLGMSQADADLQLWRGTDEGTKMKSTSGWIYNRYCSYSSGFNAFPAGGYFSGSFSYLGDYANFWSATEYAAGSAWARGLTHDATVDRGSNNKSNGSSCRCVEN
jgi:uncharacterized protein (TIGR02145 family)